MKRREFTEFLFTLEKQAISGIEKLTTEAEMKIVKCAWFYHLIGPEQNKDSLSITLWNHTETLSAVTSLLSERSTAKMILRC